MKKRHLAQELGQSLFLASAASVGATLSGEGCKKSRSPQMRRAHNSALLTFLGTMSIAYKIFNFAERKLTYKQEEPYI